MGGAVGAGCYIGRIFGGDFEEGILGRICWGVLNGIREIVVVIFFLSN